MRPARLALAASMLTAAASLATAAEREQGSAAAKCVSIEDAAARLGCYDQAFGRPAAAPAAASAIVGGDAAAAASVDAARGVDEFGLSEAAKRQRDPEKAKDTMPTSISSTVSDVSFRPTGEVVVTLENGQVWTQAETVTTKARVKAGDEVTIRKAAMGSYVLVTPSRTAIRVRRAR